MDKTHEFRVEWDKLPLDNFGKIQKHLLGGIQKTVYLVLTDQMTQMAGVTPRKLSRQERKQYKKDTHKAVSWAGSLAKCVEWQESFEKMNGSGLQKLWNKLKTKVTGHKAFRRLDRKKRKDIHKSIKQTKELTVEKLQRYLMTVGINLDYGIYELE